MTDNRQLKGMHRRDVICAGGAAVFGALVTSLLGGAKPARGASISGSVPEVDHLAVRVVVDSYQIAVAPGIKKDDVDVQRSGEGCTGEPDRCAARRCARSQKNEPWQRSHSLSPEHARPGAPRDRA